MVSRVSRTMPRRLLPRLWEPLLLVCGEEIINPGILVHKYRISEALFGMTSSAAVIGTLAAGLFIFKNKWIDLQKNLKNLFLLNSSLMLLIGVNSLLMTAIPMVYFALFIVLEFLLGFIISCVNVPLISSLQTRIPIEYQGRFFALLSFSSSLLIPLGITYTGFLFRESCRKMHNTISCILFFINPILIQYQDK